MADSVYIENLPSASSINDSDFLILEQANITTKTTVSTFRSSLGSDLDFVPTERTVNDHPLTGDISLNAEDIGLGNVSNDAQLKAASNLADVQNVATARTNLDVYSKAEIYTQEETYSQAEFNSITTYAAYYGVVADGTHDDGDALLSAIEGAGTGLLILPKGNILINQTITIPSGLTLKGQGVDATVILAGAGMSGNMVETSNAETLVGSNTDAGASAWGITDLTLDGNKANGGGVYGLYTYSYNYKISNVKVTNCIYQGFYSEGYTGVSAAGTESGAQIVNLTVLNCNLEGIYWNGPHGSQWSNVTVGNNSSVATGSHPGVYVGSSGSELQISNSISYGSTQQYAWDVRAKSVSMSNCSANGASVALFNILGNNFTWINGNVLGDLTATNTITNLQGFILGSSTVSVYNITLKGTVINTPRGVVSFVGADNTKPGDISLTGYLDTSLVALSLGINGTVPTTWNVSVSVPNAASSKGILQAGQTLMVPVGSYSNVSVSSVADSSTGVYIYGTGVGLSVGGVRSFFAGLNYNIVAKGSAAPGNNLQEAMLYYDTTRKTVRFYDGSGWRDILVS